MVVAPAASEPGEGREPVKASEQRGLYPQAVLTTTGRTALEHLLVKVNSWPPLLEEDVLLPVDALLPADAAVLVVAA